MTTHRVGALAAILFLTACAPAPPPATAAPAPIAAPAPACQPPAETATALSHRHGIRTVYRLTGDIAARFMAAFNGSEPKTDMRADTVLILVKGDLAALIFGLSDCVVHVGSAPLERVKAWARGLATGEMGA